MPYIKLYDVPKVKIFKHKVHKRFSQRTQRFLHIAIVETHCNASLLWWIHCGKKGFLNSLIPLMPTHWMQSLTDCKTQIKLLTVHFANRNSASKKITKKKAF
jgi:hypothetical protein